MLSLSPSLQNTDTYFSEGKYSTCCKNFGQFWINNEFLTVFTHQLPHICITYSQFIYFCSKVSNLLENIAILVTFISLSNIWICGDFSILKIGLRTKFNFFHVFFRIPLSNYCDWLCVALVYNETPMINCHPCLPSPGLRNCLLLPGNK